MARRSDSAARMLETHSGRFARLAFVLLLTTAGMAACAARWDTLPLDEGLLDAVRDGLGGWYEPIGGFFNGFMHYVATRVLWASTIVVLYVRRQRLSAALFLAVVPTGLLTHLVKELVGRPRPGVTLGLPEHMDTLSFPSGHVSQAAVFYGMWFVLAGSLLPARWALAVRVAGCVVVAFTGLSRVWDGAHWPSDVAGAIALGLTAVFVVLVAVPRIGALLDGRGANAKP